MDEQQLIEMGGRFLKLVGQHLGCLVVNYVALDPNGNDLGEEHVASFSGFFIEMKGQWQFVTAGHVFDDEDEGIETLRKAGRLRVTQARIVDCFGDGARDHLPTIISYDDVPKISIDNGKRGLDFAFLPLRDLYVNTIKANGVVPFRPADWAEPAEGEVIAFGVVGFPEEEKQGANGDDRVDGWIRPILVWVRPCAPPENAPKTDYPLFVAEIPFSTPKSPKGMSGGAVIALVRKDDGSTKYYLVGVQSSWNKVARVIYACPMSSFFQFMLDVIASEQE
ncbi:Uncharacterized protein OS=Rhizobium leguminosarum bv. viciae WSM1455 GN=Rleg5DRAFT_4329 PE=4 SV=1 [Gemmata massiliana]|uniref:Peptidase S1 domain-containing protein n=1 Tax=Gemmata massiliana TaxID=1210884 RepID=A0A6P2DJB0_9BACT|nr:hypothetical protein [Gemmata massiliana]VTS01660.1 Uncharacterized protein OS=Rhizobium leguminosarum bv. viciae WSM1455 GN=Rleg5DRAFT_4329 PE=4 SV=1 [Gemmata massiliana]